MTRLYTLIESLFVRDEDGQGLAEYALILAFIAVLAIVALAFLGGRINTVLSQIGNSCLEAAHENGAPPTPRTGAPRCPALPWEDGAHRPNGSISVPGPLRCTSQRWDDPT
jgi:pilus assembly protein Flp/PilA